MEVLAADSSYLSATVIDTCATNGIELNGEYYYESGMYTRVFPDEEGCNRIDYLILTIQEQIINNQQESICPGDTLLINGIVFTGPVEDYLLTFPIENACDSIVALDINWQDQPEVTEVYFVCNGDSVEINGQFLTGDTSGTYLIPTLGSTCDTLIQFSLEELDPITITDEQIIPDNGTGNGSINVQIGGGFPDYSFLWSTGDSTQFVEQLSGGLYLLTVTDGMDCIATFTFEIPLVNSVESEEEATAYLELLLNPSKLSGRLRCHLPNGVGHLYIVNNLGEEVDTYTIRSKTSILTLKKYPTGIYYLILKSGNNTLQVEKLVQL